jgi:hypothetical protein
MDQRAMVQENRLWTHCSVGWFDAWSGHGSRHGGIESVCPFGFSVFPAGS